MNPDDQCGWQIVPFDHHKPLSAYDHHAIEEYPTENGPADYALVIDGQLLGVVEAKKVTLGPQNVLTQAERYSKGIDGTPSFRGYGSPFLYSTNGEVVWFQDVRHKLNRSRKIAGFHTPAALREMRSRDVDAACEWFAEHPRCASRSGRGDHNGSSSCPLGWRGSPLTQPEVVTRGHLLRNGSDRALQRLPAHLVRFGRESGLELRHIGACTGAESRDRLSGCYSNPRFFVPQEPDSPRQQDGKAPVT